jgi:ribosomal protein S18 acetylase RimI-like enzyme
MSAVTSLDPHPPNVVAVRATLGAAFADDPMLQWIFRGVPQAEQATAAWLGLFVDAFAAGGVVDVVLDDAGSPVATAMWRVDGSPLPYPQLPNLGGLMVAFLGPERASAVGAGLGAFATHKPEPPFHYLQFLAVHPQHQGAGLGRALVAHGQARARATGQSVYLESTNPRNLPFYRSLGFEARDEFVLAPDGPPAYGLWWQG